MASLISVTMLMVSTFLFTIGYSQTVTPTGMLYYSKTIMLSWSNRGTDLLLYLNDYRVYGHPIVFNRECETHLLIIHCFRAQFEVHPRQSNIPEPLYCCNQ